MVKSIDQRMEKIPSSKQPPGIIRAITSGFNLIANNIYLILFPVVIDLFLWFGPHLRIYNLFLPEIENVMKAMLQASTPELQELMSGSEVLWKSVLTHINLFGALRTIPVGIPSLLASLSPVASPLGAVNFWEVTSAGDALLAWLVISVAGIVATSIYFNLIGSLCSTENSKNVSRSLWWKIGQLLLFNILITLLALLLVVPISFLLSILAFISPALVQIGFFVIVLVLVWVIFPFVFTPFGIFSKGLNLFQSIWFSIRLIRMIFPRAGLFFLIVIFLNQALNMLWQTPGDDSWMMLVGILGNGFVNSAFIASIFVFFGSNVAWVQEKLNQNFRNNDVIVRKQ